MLRAGFPSFPPHSTFRRTPLWNRLSILQVSLGSQLASWALRCELALLPQLRLAEQALLDHVVVAEDATVGLRIVVHRPPGLLWVLAGVGGAVGSLRVRTSDVVQAVHGRRQLANLRVFVACPGIAG